MAIPTHRWLTWCFVPLTTRRRPSLADFEVAAAAVPPVDDRIVHQVPVASIRDSGRNPRAQLPAIDELADSLREHGPLQPIVVRRLASGYELIAGHRRLQAAKVLGWTDIAAVVREETADQAYNLTLVENLQREDLTPKEEASALESLVRERGWTTRQVGEAIKRSHIYVSRRLRVFEDEILAGPVLANQLPVSTAEELLRAEADIRPTLVEQAVAERWGQAQARRAVLERNVPDRALEPNVPSAPQHSRELVRTAKQQTRRSREKRACERSDRAGRVESLLDVHGVSDLPPRARAELRRLYQRLALLVAD